MYAAYEQAGRELVTAGHIRPSTARRANQEIVPMPLFSILKHLKSFKKIMIARAQEMIDTMEGWDEREGLLPYWGFIEVN